MEEKPGIPDATEFWAAMFLFFPKSKPGKDFWISIYAYFVDEFSSVLSLFISRTPELQRHGFECLDRI